MAEKPQAWTEDTTNQLRFVRRRGKLILQQAHTWASLDKLTGGVDWHDVPLVEEDEVIENT